MICRVKYFNPIIGAYAGAEYTYLADMDLKPMQKVLVPAGIENEVKKAIVTATNLPMTVISPAWADKLKKVKDYDRC